MRREGIFLSSTVMINFCLAAIHAGLDSSKRCDSRSLGLDVFEQVSLFHHFTVRPCRDLIPPQLHRSPSLLPFKCFPHLFVSVAVNVSHSLSLLPPPPLTFSPPFLSSPAAFKLTECDWWLL